MNDPSQVLDVLRDVLLKHMDGAALDDYRIQCARFIGASGRLIGDRQIGNANDVPVGLRLTMRSGAEYDLTLTDAGVSDSEDDDDDVDQHR